MRLMTDDEQGWAEEIVAEIFEALAFTTFVTPAALSMMACRATQLCSMRHASDPSFPPDWRWEVHVVQNEDRYGDLHPSGDLIMRPASIDGKQVDWSCDPAPFIRHYSP